ncbi:M67 family metallopeptidase [uncultured Erythrobacter sp.]|uniref:M67 family metallopeptidase n=1 Tax=uncultured Erythrobacter sp. TaxID=263913 RepID=UPI002606B8A6|nr:M67 family metallopeptidase [uncultured Erythrobacter sp.]
MTTARKEKRSFDKVPPESAEGLRTSGERVIVMWEGVLGELHRSARKAYPREACGILLGEGAQITQFAEAANVHPTPETHFEIDPQALIDAHRSERAGGAQIQGYFHSHPNGQATPSVMDQDMAARDGRIWAILGENEVKFWRDAPEGFEPLSYSVTAE